MRNYKEEILDVLNAAFKDSSVGSRQESVDLLEDIYEEFASTIEVMIDSLAREL